MRKLILVSAMILACASAQAGERSLTLGRGENSSPAAATPTASQGRIAEVPAAPVVEPPPKPPETPRYVERPAPVAAPAPAPQTEAQPSLQQANVQPTATPVDKPVAAKPTSARASGHRRHAQRWTEGRIIRELHRHGIYW